MYPPPHAGHACGQLRCACFDSRDAFAPLLLLYVMFMEVLGVLHVLLPAWGEVVDGYLLSAHSVATSEIAALACVVLFHWLQLALISHAAFRERPPPSGRSDQGSAERCHQD